MRKLILAAAMAAAAVLPATAQEHASRDGAWTDYPVMTTGRAGRAAAAVRLTGLDAGSVRIHPPEGEPWEVSLNDGKGRFETRGVGNYHWVVAREQTGAAVRIATAAQYFSNPGPAPAELLSRPMGELEVVPDPIPREHAHYRAGETWPFVVRFEGKPLAGATVELRTRYGSMVTAVTDEDGRVRLPVPDDLPEDVATSKGPHGRPPSVPMVVAARHEAGGTRYLATFSDTYRPNAFADRSVWPGVASMLVGMLAAAPLLRRKNKEAS